MSKKHAEAPEDKLTPAEEQRVENAIALSDEQEGLEKYDFSQDVNTYKDEFDRSAIQIPFLRILQANSPQCTPGEPGYVEDARPGMFINTVTGEVLKKVEIIPVYHYSTLIAWVPRTQGGGFVKDYGFEEGTRALATCHKNEENGRDVLPSGDELVRTEVYFALVLKESGVEQVMLTFTSTQLKKARNWNSRLRLLKTEIPGQGVLTGAPMFFNSWVLTTTSEKNDKGSWQGYVITQGTPTLKLGQATYLAAKAFREVCEQGIKQGRIKMDEAKPEEASGDQPF